MGNCVGCPDVGTTVGAKELYCAMVVGAKVGINVVHNLHDMGQAALIFAPIADWAMQPGLRSVQEAGFPRNSNPVTALSAQGVGALVGKVEEKPGVMGGEGEAVGVSLGTSEGVDVGCWDGVSVGNAEGACDGPKVGVGVAEFTSH